MHFNSLRRCEGLNGSRLDLTQVLERRHGLRVSRTERRFLVTVISLSAQQLENLSKVANECMLRFATVGDRISKFEVFKHRCADHCSLLESTRRWVESLCCMVTKVTCSTKGSNVAKKINAWIQKELRDSQYRGCTVAYKENNVDNIYMKPRETKTDAMPLSGDSESVGLPAGSEPVRPENPDPEVPGGARDSQVPGRAHDPMRDDVDGDEAMVPRVPNLPPEPSVRQIAEHELTGHAVYRSWCCHCVASKGRAHAHSSREEGELPEIGIDNGFFGRDKEDVLPILCVKCRNSSTGCVGATVS